jgi:hypothetical protein
MINVLYSLGGSELMDHDNVQVYMETIFKNLHCNCTSM